MWCSRSYLQIYFKISGRGVLSKVTMCHIPVMVATSSIFLKTVNVHNDAWERMKEAKYAVNILSVSWQLFSFHWIVFRAFSELAHLPPFVYYMHITHNTWPNWAWYSSFVIIERMSEQVPCLGSGCVNNRHSQEHPQFSPGYQQEILAVKTEWHQVQ